jgi:FAD/FMN-containing dehydrogenase
VLLGELDRATQAVGLATPTGNVSLTGVAGLTLGGGLGWIARKHGPACDNLIAAEVVTADGERVRASVEENPDLLWGLRGGGGNFGVVTSFEYRLHPVGPEVIGGGVLHSFADAPDVFRFFADFVSIAPDELSVVASTFRASAEMPVPAELVDELVIVLAVCYAGDRAEGERALAPLRAFGHPLADFIGPMPYTALQSASDASYPDGQHNYWKSHFVDEINDDVIATLMEYAPRMSSPLSSFYFQHLGGAISRGRADEAAFGHRDGVFDFSILTVWQDPAETDTHVTWARDLFGAMQPHANGVYVNNLGVEGADRVKAAYARDTYRRLVALKDVYDPQNIFRLNQNIAPSHVPDGAPGG